MEPFHFIVVLFIIADFMFNPIHNEPEPKTEDKVEQHETNQKEK